jgi:hypothetical protein
MSARLASAVSLLGFLLLGAGCSTLIAAASTKLGRDTPVYPSHTARHVVEDNLGRPVLATPLPDGGVLATYRYRGRVSQPNVVGGIAAEIDVGTLRADPRLWLLLQPLLIPTAIGAAMYTVFDPRYETVTFGFGPDDDLLYVGAPPPYGASDDDLAAPSIGALRKSCGAGPAARNPDAAEREYVECVTGRFAVWGLE